MAGMASRPATVCFWKDHKGTAWAVSGDSFFYMLFLLSAEPRLLVAGGGQQDNPEIALRSCRMLPAMPDPFFSIDYTRNDQHPAAQQILYTTTWPDNVPILKVGETLTFPGGEYHADNPTTAVIDRYGRHCNREIRRACPESLAGRREKIVFDTLNPVMDDQLVFDHYTARLFPALEQRTVNLPLTNCRMCWLPPTSAPR